MTDQEFDKWLDNDYRTSCCQDKWTRHGCADLRCDKCGGDVTLEIVFIYKASMEVK